MTLSRRGKVDPGIDISSCCCPNFEEHGNERSKTQQFFCDFSGVLEIEMKKTIMVVTIKSMLNLSTNGLDFHFLILQFEPKQNSKSKISRRDHTSAFLQMRRRRGSYSRSMDHYEIRFTRASAKALQNLIYST